MARPENNNLGNICRVTVIVDPKNTVKESNENNNTRSVLAFDPDSRFVFRVLGGNAGVSGYGSQSPAGNEPVVYRRPGNRMRHL